MAYGVKDSCIVCDLPSEKRLEVEARLIRGDTFESTAVVAGCNLMTVRAHMDKGHVTPDTRQLRDWMQKHGPGPIEKQLEKARTTALAQIDQSPTITQEDINRRLLVLERYGHMVLQRIESSADPNDRTAIMGLESLRRLCADLASLNGIKGNNPADTVESIDVQALRQSILESVGKAKPEGWKPLR